MLDAALPDKGELTDKYGECDTAVYSCLLLSAQQEASGRLHAQLLPVMTITSCPRQRAHSREAEHTRGCNLQPLTHALLRQEAQVERVRQEAADRVASAEIRVQVADRRCGGPQTSPALRTARLLRRVTHRVRQGGGG